MIASTITGYAALAYQTVTSGSPLALLYAFNADKVVFYDWDVVNYYYRLIKNFYDGYSWQVRVSYALTVFSILLMIVLFWMFFFRVRKRTRYNRQLQEVRENFREPFIEVMSEVDIIKPSQVEEICKHTRHDFDKYSPSLFVALLIELRQELQEVVYIPNLQVLSQVCGVLDYLENNLLNNRRVFSTMQTLTMLNLRISEGRLANYVNHRSRNIRQMARMSYMICSDMEPYRYLVEDLNEPMASWREMSLHQLFGWLRACDRRMPNLLTLVNRVKDPHTAGFIIEEIAYWGTEDEKSKLNTFFLEDRFDCRSAAFKSVAFLRDSKQEQNMIDTYNSQPEPMRRKILKAVYAIKSGKQVEFFNHIYHTTASKETREVTLTCLYDYSEEGRRTFEHLRFENNQRDRQLIDQIDSFNLLNQIRSYN